MATTLAAIWSCLRQGNEEATRPDSLGYKGEAGQRDAHPRERQNRREMERCGRGSAKIGGDGERAALGKGNREERRR